MSICSHDISLSVSDGYQFKFNDSRIQSLGSFLGWFPCRRFSFNRMGRNVWKFQIVLELHEEKSIEMSYRSSEFFQFFKHFPFIFFRKAPRQQSVNFLICKVVTLTACHRTCWCSIASVVSNNKSSTMSKLIWLLSSLSVSFPNFNFLNTSACICVHSIVFIWGR